MSLIKDTKGSAFIIVIISMAVILILSTSIVSIASSNFMMGQAERRYQTAYYVAEAGIRHQIEHMRLRMEEIHSRTPPPADAVAFFNVFNPGAAAPPLELGNLGNDPARAVISMITTPTSGNPRIYRFRSQATVGNVTRNVTRTLEGSVTIEWALIQPPPIYFERALFSNASLTMSGGTFVDGGVTTNASANGSVELSGGAWVTGGVILGPGSTSQTVRLTGGSQIHGGQTISATTKPIPTFSSPGDVTHNLTPRGNLNLSGANVHTINANESYSAISLTGASRLTFDLTNRDLLIRVDGNINLSGGARIDVIGNGRLYLFVNGNVNLSGGTHLAPGHTPIRVVLFVSGRIDLSGGTSIRAGIYAPTSTLSMSGGASIQGSAMVNTTNLSGGANISFVQIDTAGIAHYMGAIPGFVPPERMIRDFSWREP